MAAIHRVSAIVLCLALVAGNLAVCAGWATTAEARMACCAHADTCPMHNGETHDASQRLVISQAQADSCCAGSERSNQSSPSLNTSMPSVVVDAGEVLRLQAPSLAAHDVSWTVVPIPIAQVPRHILLSVFLV